MGLGRVEASLAVPELFSRGGGGEGGSGWEGKWRGVGNVDGNREKGKKKDGERGGGGEVE